MTVVTLDFETYFDADYGLRKLTTEQYVRDPRFEVIGVGVKIAGRAAVWLEEWQFRQWAARVNWSCVMLVAHHAQFDGFILSERYGVKPGAWICTMSMGRALHGPVGVGLKILAPKYGLGYKGNDTEWTRGMRRRNFTAEQYAQFGRYCLNDVELTDGLRRRMTPRLPKTELWQIDTHIRFFTEPKFKGNQAILVEARDAERKRKREFLDKLAASQRIKVRPGEEPLEACRATLSSSDKFAALLRSMGEEPPTKWNKKHTERIYAFAKNDPGMQDLLEHRNEEIQFLAQARLAVKSTIIETRTERLFGIAKRGAIPLYLKYCGAHTHRSSGGDKMNPQNFNRGGSLRAALEALGGTILAVADSGQIEARVVGWLARQLDLLETFRRNDAKNAIYEPAFAQRCAERAKTLGRELTEDDEKLITAELTREGKPPGDFYSDVGSVLFNRKIDPKSIERQISKALALGLGFGMGWLKCACEMLKGMLGTKPVQFTFEHAARFKVDVKRWWNALNEKMQARVKATPTRLALGDFVTHCAVVSYLVDLWRKNNAKIVKLWKDMQRVIEVMARPGDDRGKVRMKFGPLEVMRHAIRKPSGLVLHYPGLHRKGKDFYYLGGKSGRELTKIYGGLLTENLVQSIARDIVFDQALWTRADGYPLGTTTHDEIVATPAVEDGERCCKQMIARMKVPPAYAADLPLWATGGVAVSYGDAK